MTLVKTATRLGIGDGHGMLFWEDRRNDSLRIEELAPQMFAIIA